MAEGTVVLPPDSTGKAMRTQTGGASMPASTHQPVETLADAAGNLVTSQGGDTKRALDVNIASSTGGMNQVSGALTGSGVSVSATTVNAGNVTIVLAGGTYTNLPLIFEASVDSGTNWFPVDGARADGTGVDIQTTLPSAGVRAWNFMSPGYTNIRIRQTAAASTQTGNPTAIIAQGPTLYDPSPSIAPLDSNKLTYSTTLNNTNVAAAVTASVPVWEFVNAGTTKVCRITRIAWELTLATAGAAPEIILQKRTAASTGGTAVTQTPTSHDTINATATATMKYYTAIPTVAGSSLGNIRGHRVFAPATTLTVTPSWIEWLFGTRPGQAIVIRPGESLNMQGLAAFGTVPTMTGSIEWTEE